MESLKEIFCILVFSMLENLWLILLANTNQ